MNFIDNIARGWIGGAAGGGEGGGKTNLYRLFGIAMTSRSIHIEPR